MDRQQKKEYILFGIILTVCVGICYTQFKYGNSNPIEDCQDLCNVAYAKMTNYKLCCWTCMNAYYYGGLDRIENYTETLNKVISRHERVKLNQTESE